MNAYKKFAYCYDEVMQELDYHLWEEFTLPYLKQGDKILDLACGTGTFLSIMHLNGYKCEGLDLSETIIEIAKEKAKLNRFDIKFHVADMTNFNLESKFNVITCYFDSVNFLEDKNDLKRMFKTVYNHLEDNGYFIFDTFSKTLMKEYEGNVISEDHESFKIDWRTKLLSNKSLEHTIKITEFDDCYTEKYREHYYEFKDFDLTGFKLIKVAGDFNDDLEPTDERILYVLQKIA